MSKFDLISPLQDALTDKIKAPARREAIAMALEERASRNKPFTKTLKEDAENYQPSPELKTAVNAALSQGRPLLLTGEPGSGKTQAAYWIALLFGLEDRVLEYQVRSESRAKELRYDFDAVSWFRQSQLAALNKNPKPVLKSKHIREGVLGKAFGWSKDEVADKPYVVLIDEIDKAPRDFPNDLLLELSQMRFTVEESEERQQIGPPEHRPFIVITSNAERRLPDPFLRRCIVHDIKLDEATVVEIFRTKLRDFNLKDDALIESAATFWTGLGKISLARKPTVAEFWQGLALEAMHGGRPANEVAAKLGKENLRELKFIAMQFSAQDLDKIAGPAKS